MRFADVIALVVIALVVVLFVTATADKIAISRIRHAIAVHFGELRP